MKWKNEWEMKCYEREEYWDLMKWNSGELGEKPGNLDCAHHIYHCACIEIQTQDLCTANWAVEKNQRIFDGI